MSTYEILGKVQWIFQQLIPSWLILQIFEVIDGIALVQSVSANNY